MLAKVEVADKYIFYGVMMKIISMDLENNGFVYFINLCRYKLMKSIFSRNSNTKMSMINLVIDSSVFSMAILWMT